MFKELLTVVGKYASKANIHLLNATVNYLEVGRWLQSEGFTIPKRLSNRYLVYDQVIKELKDSKLLYLEFGVFRGESLKYWSTNIPGPQSQFFGFDSFEGLPEDWNISAPKHTFSTSGALPDISDPRVQFVKGWFKDTLPTFSLPPHDQLIINIDADLYSSAQLILGILAPQLRVGTYIYFDEFCDRHHELKAFAEFLEETKMKCKVVACDKTLANVVFQRIG